MDFAITSLPVPVSPRMRTEQSADATVSTSSSTARNFGLDPIKSGISNYLLLTSTVLGTCTRSDLTRDFPCGTVRVIAATPFGLVLFVKVNVCDEMLGAIELCGLSSRAV